PAGNRRPHDNDFAILQSVQHYRMASRLSHAYAQWVPAISYFHDLTYVCAPSAFQHGATAGLQQLPDSFYANLIQEYQLKGEMICAALRVAGLEPSVPAGAYYVLADASVVPGADSVEKA